MRTNDRIVYKVVRINDGRFRSAMHGSLDDKYSLVYSIGVKTTPVIGRIFIFKDLNSAELFKKVNFFTTNILKGVATDVGFPKLLADGFMYVNDLLSFWDNKLKKKKLHWSEIKYIPKGTLSCSSFTPTEVVL